jgi:hypothetical protein
VTKPAIKRNQISVQTIQYRIQVPGIHFWREKHIYLYKGTGLISQHSISKKEKVNQWGEMFG